MNEFNPYLQKVWNTHSSYASSTKLINCKTLLELETTQQACVAQLIKSSIYSSEFRIRIQFRAAESELRIQYLMFTAWHSSEYWKCVFHWKLCQRCCTTLYGIARYQILTILSSRSCEWPASCKSKDLGRKWTKKLRSKQTSGVNHTRAAILRVRVVSLSCIRLNI